MNLHSDLKLKLKSSSMYYLFLFLIVSFNVFTYAQVYYNFSLNVFLFTMCLATAKLQDYEIILIIKEFFIWCGVILVMSFALLMSSREHFIYNLITENLHIFIALTLYIITTARMEYKANKVFLIGVTAVVLIGSVASFVVLQNDVNASRLLAGAATELQRSVYYQMGVGGYGYIYFIVFLNYALLESVSAWNSLMQKILVIICISINALVIVFASYSIALLMGFLLLALFLIKRKSKRKTIILFLIFVSAFLTFKNDIFAFIKNIADQLELYYVSKRMEQLINADLNNSYSNLRRMELYKESWDAFLSNILVGTSNVGGHSQVLDVLGKYGLFGVTYITYLIHVIKRCVKTVHNNTSFIVFTLYFLFAFIDRIDARETIMGVLLVVPLYMFFSNKKTEESASNSGELEN